MMKFFLVNIIGTESIEHYYHLPKVSSHEGCKLQSITINEYINKSGGLTRLASSNYIFIVSPNGETLRVETNGIRRFITQTYDIYPGSVIYVPRHIGKVDGINLYATLAPIFSSLALSIASLNSIND